LLRRALPQASSPEEVTSVEKDHAQTFLATLTLGVMAFSGGFAIALFRVKPNW